MTRLQYLGTLSNLEVKSALHEVDESGEDGHETRSSRASEILQENTYLCSQEKRFLEKLVKKYSVCVYKYHSGRIIVH